LSVVGGEFPVVNSNAGKPRLSVGEGLEIQERFGEIVQLSVGQVTEPIGQINLTLRAAKLDKRIHDVHNAILFSRPD
jgi:hypothetical protein